MEYIFKAIDLEGKIIENISQIEFFEDGHIIINEEIPIKELIITNKKMKRANNIKNFMQYNNVGTSEKVLFKVPGLMIWRARWDYMRDEFKYTTHIELFGIKINS